MVACGGICRDRADAADPGLPAASSTVAPFEYSFMFWGVLWGWLFWREIPDAIAGWASR